MELFYFTNREELDRFAAAEYLQSWAWGDFLQASGEEIRRLGVRNGQKIVAAATIVKKRLGGSFYWYAPRGPLLLEVLTSPEAGQQLLNFLFAAILDLDRRALFVRIEPTGDKKAWSERRLAWPLKKTINLQPAQTLLLDLHLPEAELLAAMQPKTRYNIRLAEKKGVVIKPGTADDFSELWRLLHLTGARDGFRIHPAAHYQKMLETPDHSIRLFLASYAGQNIAAALFSYGGDTVSYMHGASDNKLRNLMAPHLLQWTAIKEAQAQAYRYYDFCGIDAKKWPGVTRFKLGFGGQIKDYPGTFDVVFRPVLYGVYNVLRRLRRLI